MVPLRLVVRAVAPFCVFLFISARTAFGAHHGEQAGPQEYGSFFKPGGLSQKGSLGLKHADTPEQKGGASE